MQEQEQSASIPFERVCAVASHVVVVVVVVVVAGTCFRHHATPAVASLEGADGPVMSIWQML